MEISLRITKNDWPLNHSEDRIFNIRYQGGERKGPFTIEELLIELKTKLEVR